MAGTTWKQRGALLVIVVVMLLVIYNIVSRDYDAEAAEYYRKIGRDDLAEAKVSTRKDSRGRTIPKTTEGRLARLEALVDEMEGQLHAHNITLTKLRYQGGDGAVGDGGVRRLRQAQPGT